MSKNIIITILAVIVLAVGALIWIWNSEYGALAVIPQASAPQSTWATTTLIVNVDSLTADINNLQVEDPAQDFQSLDQAASGL